VTGIGNGSALEQTYGGRDNFGGFQGGGFSEYLVAFEKQLTPVLEEIPDKVAVLAEPFTIGLHAVGRKRPGDNETVLVIGGGIIGLMTIAAIRALGSKCSVILLARYPFQREAAKRLGVDEVILDRDTSVVYEKIGQWTGGTLLKPLIGKKIAYGDTGPDVVFDSVGTDTSIDDALRLVRCNGTIVLIGMAFGITKKTEWALQLYKELDILGAINSGLEDYQGRRIDTFELAVKLLAEEPQKYSELVTHTYKIEEYKAALNAFGKKSRNGTIKSVFDFT
jgi:threonine dehydrogenase-like Zn-dependent dehydrogenase